MIETITYKGVWFLPENPNHQVSGTLTFEPNSEPNLELLGTLTTKNNRINEPLFILGFSSDGKIITLYKSFEYSRSYSLPGMETSSFIPMYVLIGKHFSSETEFNFKIIKGRFKNLENWINISGFKNVNTDFETHTTKIEYQLPDPIKFNIDENINGLLNFTSSSPFHIQTLKAVVEQKSEIHLEFKQEKPFFYVLKELMLFQNFLTLATFEPAYPISIVLVAFNPNDHEDFTRIDVFFKPGFNYVADKKSIGRSFLFEYQDISENFESIIQTWFKLNERIAPITNLLFDSFYDQNGFNENKFLNIIHALETFHRRFKKNEILTQTEYETKVNNIISAIPENTRHWLKEILGFKNEPTLQMRLEELLASTSNETTRKLISNKDKFIKETKNSRNYYTHYDVKLENKALKGNELYQLTQKLRVLLIITLLLETGFNKESVDMIFKNKENRFFKHLFEETSPDLSS